MNPNKKEQTAIRDWMKAVEFRQNRLWTITNGIAKTGENGREMTSEEFDLLHPIPNPVNFYGGKENCDPHHKYLFT